EPLAPCPVELFSISSRGQNTSLAKQGLSAASTHTTSLCRQDYCVPGGRWSASSLRTSRCMTSVVTEPTRQCRRDNPSHLRPLCSNALVSRISMHGAQVAAVSRFAARLMKIVGRDQRPLASRTKYIFEQGHLHAADHLVRHRAACRAAARLSGPARLH